MNRLAILFLAGTTLGLTGCGDRDAAASEQSEPAPTTGTTSTNPPVTTPSPSGRVRPAPMQEEIGQIPDLRVTDGFYLGGQPEVPDFESLRMEGARTVVDLRMPTEARYYDEPGAVIAAGLEYRPFGFTAESLNDEILDNVLAVMRDKSLQPMLVHCESANRVGAVWLAFRALEDGLSEDAALAEARTVGLTSPKMQEKVLEYVRKKKK